MKPRAIVTAAWLGLAAGLVEVVIVFARARVFQGGLYHRSPHVVWMIPAASLAILVVAGLPLALLERAFPRVGRILADYVLWTLAFLAPILAIPGLGALACLVLAAGLAAWVVPAIRSHADGFRRVVRWSLPRLAAVVLVLATIAFGGGTLRTRRPRPEETIARPGSPNVLLIVMDTVRADATSLRDQGRRTTPNLETLARRGIRFDRAIATAPWTLPSHASMFTGRWSWELAVGSDRPLDGRYPTLAEYLGRHGYATAGFVANTFLCGAEYGLGRGFDHYEDHVLSPLVALRSSALGWLICKELRVVLDRVYPALGLEPRHPLELDFARKDAARIDQAALAWIAERGDRPFFAFLNYYDAHDPYLVPDAHGPHFGRRPRTLADFQVLRNWTPQDPRPRRPEEIALARDAYDDCIAYLDGQLGRLFDGLKRLGQLEKTIIIVTADHGEHFGEHRIDGRPLFGHAVSLYQPEIHVPLLIVAPGRVRPETVVEGPVSLRDLPATVVDLLGLEAGSPFPGRSLVASSRSDVLSELDSRAELPTDRRFAGPVPGLMRALVEGGTVYHHREDGREELYDLANDPGETRDLSDADGSGDLLKHSRAALERLVPATRP